MAEGKHCLGTSINDIYGGQGPFHFNVLHLSPSKFHAVLYEIPVSLNAPPRPHRNSQAHHWDVDYVRMPFSSSNLFPVKDEQGEETLKNRWELINESLLQPINTSYELEAAINSYNTRLPKFLALHHLFEEVLDKEETKVFFDTVLPGIINLALQLPDILPGNLPLLKKDSCKSVSLSQLQIASLLANGFLCTFPWRKDVSCTYPGANFVRLFMAHLRHKRKNCVAEKLKCILHYFRRVLAKAPTGVVTFERKSFQKNQVPRWDRLENNLGNTRIHVSSFGTIEDNGHGLLQVDFANKFVGGGVLGYGCVQEEIRFVICPELIISRLFTEELGPREALVIIGVERYSNYTGYGDTFIWNGNYEDETPFDMYGRRRTSIVAIDAIRFNKSADQFNSSLILRELNKAYVGFHSRQEDNLAPVATGNWGCGAFRGDPKLKFVIQLMACSASNRNMVYYTFGSSELCETIYDIYTFLATNKVTITELWRLLCGFAAAQLKPEKFCAYIQQAYFDNKNQPSIKKMFSCFRSQTEKLNECPEKKYTLNNNHSLEAVEPSTSTETDIENWSQSDVVESSQEEVTIKNHSRNNLIQNQNEVISLINIIDGDNSALQKNEQTEVTSLLSSIDKLTNFQQNESQLEVESVCLEMDIEENCKESENSQCKLTSENCKVKRKITDYFVKTNK